MRISDWSSDVCSSDLVGRDPGRLRVALMRQTPAGTPVDPECVAAARAAAKLLESLGHHVEEAAPKVDVAALGTANFAAISTALAVDVEDRAKLTGIAPSPEMLEKDRKSQRLNSSH